MMEEIDESNYVEYQTSPSMKWAPALFCAEVIEHALANQYKSYMERMQKSDCKAEIKRLLEAGPPVWVADKHGMPLPEGETHVCRLWFMKDNREVSAMLEGAVDGAERQALWDELAAFLGPEVCHLPRVPTPFAFASAAAAFAAPAACRASAGGEGGGGGCA